MVQQLLAHHPKEKEMDQIEARIVLNKNGTSTESCQNQTFR
jgi:hypothetical protein